MIRLYRQDPPIASFGLGKLSRFMMLEPLRQHARRSGVSGVIAQLGIGAALMAIHNGAPRCSGCRTSPSTSGLLLLRQPIGNPAVQALEFGPAHFHRDIVRTEDWICNEIQLHRIPIQDRIAAHRSVDQPPSHVRIRRPIIERYSTILFGNDAALQGTDRPLKLIHESRERKQKGKDVASDGELNYV